MKPFERKKTVTIGSEFKSTDRILCSIFWLILLYLAMVANSSYAQDILLDKQVRAGELTLYPSLRNSKEYYYVANQIQLARNENDVPKFSFVQYVDSLTGTGNESEGGGIVHALVELSVDEETLNDAQRALSEIDSGGVIRGAVPFNSGKFALISSFADVSGNFTDSLMGIGNAPLLEGERAAVSLRLTRDGAERLNGSLQSPTPDLSFSFEMELDGYRSPKQAILTADFERIYSHDLFNAGVATPYLQAEIEMAFDELKDNGAIALTEIGSDENFSELIQTAYGKLIEIMFKRAPSTGTDAMTRLQSGTGNNKSLLDRAESLLSSQRRETRQENGSINDRNTQQAKLNAQAVEKTTQAAELRRQHQEATDRAENARQLEARSQARLDAELAMQQNSGNLTADEQDLLQRRIDAARQTVQSHQAESERAENEATQLQSQLEESEAQATAAQSSVRELEDPESMPSLAVVASYKMKRSKASGKFTINLNKYTVSKKTERFDRNLGDLRRYLDQIVSVVDVGDTAFRRREVGVLIDGLNSKDFAEFVNSATVILEKKHKDGSVTQREISVNRQNFSKQENLFNLAYNRLGDEQSSEFLEYNFEVLWNFFGGIEVNEPIRKTRVDDITLSPPMARNTINIEADPEKITSQGIRAILLRLFYNPGDRERTIDVQLRPDGENKGLSKAVDIILPVDRSEYAYEMQWILRDGSRRNSGKITTDQSLIFADFIPEG